MMALQMSLQLNTIGRTVLQVNGSCIHLLTSMSVILSY
ncbi:hypothetical protein yinte0001_27300 [Yersinia intermedia ATCC 29909]|nr:hypothetical protein yinte0001_27300 [Yersinia intermedia ATCC 29909]